MVQQTIASPAQQVLSKIEALAEKHFLPIIGPEKGAVLTQTVHQIRPRHVLEVGTLIGYSAILMGKDMSQNSEMVTIEIHEDEAEIAQQNILHAQIPAKVQVIAGDAKAALPIVCGSFDLMFIDAEKNEYLTYLQLAEDKLHKGSVVVADNAGLFAQEMADYLTYVRSSGRYISRYYGFGSDGVEVSTKL